MLEILTCHHVIKQLHVTQIKSSSISLKQLHVRIGLTIIVISYPLILKSTKQSKEMKSQ